MRSTTWRQHMHFRRLITGYPPYLLGVILAALSPALSSCDLYSVSQTKDGSTLVVNKVNGSIRKVSDDTYIEVTAQPRSRTGALHGLTPSSLPKTLVHVTGVAKYIGDGEMLVRIFVQPKPGESKSAEGWARWRSYMKVSQGWESRLNIQFLDKDQFVITTHSASVDTFTPAADDDGNIVEYHTQVSVPIAEGKFSQVADWAVGWASWPPPEALARTKE